MKPAFENTELWEAFREELLSWKGTPYRHLQRTKGRGADCTLYLADVLFKVGIFKSKVKTKFYPKNWYLNSNSDVVIENMKNNFNYNTAKGYVWVKYESTEEFVEGDILLFSIRPSINFVHHTSVYVGVGKMFHGMDRRAFDLVEVTDQWKRFCKGFYRLCESET